VVLDISDGKGKPGALQKPTDVAQWNERGDPRRGAPEDFRIGGEKSLPQLAQGVAPNRGREQQAVLPEMPAEAGEEAGDVVHDLEVEERHDEVVSGTGERQHLGIDQRDSFAVEKCRDPVEDETSRRGDAAHGQWGRVGTHDQRLLEGAGDGEQALGQIFDDEGGHEVVGSPARQAAGDELAVEDFWRYGHRNRAAFLVGSGLMESEDGLVKMPLSVRAATLLRRAGVAVLDQIYPPLCLHCEAPVATADALCGNCFRQLRLITAPYCPRLGTPFEVSLGPDALSAEAIADPPPFDRARSAVVYNDVARRLVSRLKYGDRPELARFCARLMATAGQELWRDTPIVVPVPLHATRQFERRYNQSTELARALGRITGLRVDPGLVIRSRRTRQQVGLSADARQRNVAGAFTVRSDALARTRGGRVVIVDDVITTGSTVKAVTRALNRAGIDNVDVISFARVVTRAELV
jgi:ComF family protein